MFFASQKGRHPNIEMYDHNENVSVEFFLQFFDLLKVDCFCNSQNNHKLT